MGTLCWMTNPVNKNAVLLKKIFSDLPLQKSQEGSADIVHVDYAGGATIIPGNGELYQIKLDKGFISNSIDPETGVGAGEIRIANVGYLPVILLAYLSKQCASHKICTFSFSDEKGNDLLMSDWNSAKSIISLFGGDPNCYRSFAELLGLTPKLFDFDTLADQHKYFF